MAIVKKYQARVVSIYNPVTDLYTIQLESLNGPFKYTPGQFLHLALDPYDPSYAWPESRCFSMQSSPQDKLIKITFAVKGVFTKRMATEMKVDKLLNIKLPYGDLFTQEHSKENTIFIAGGTGITPFLSLFTDSSFASYSNPVLYAGFRNKDMNLYHAELQKAEEINPELTILMTYQDESGILNKQKILKDNNLRNFYYISGPPAMINSFKTYFIDQNIQENHIITDDWE